MLEFIFQNMTLVFLLFVVSYRKTEGFTIHKKLMCKLYQTYRFISNFAGLYPNLWKNSSAHHCHAMTEFRCISDGKCIPLAKHCDKIRDCADASDEDYCGKFPLAYHLYLTVKIYEWLLSFWLAEVLYGRD